MGSTGLITDGSLVNFQPPFWKDKTTLENENLEENETNDSFKSQPASKIKIDEAEGLKLNLMKNRDAENEQEIEKVESLDDLDEQTDEPKDLKITLSRLIIDRCLEDSTNRTEESLITLSRLIIDRCLEDSTNRTEESLDRWRLLTEREMADVRSLLEEKYGVLCFTKDRVAVNRQEIEKLKSQLALQNKELNFMESMTKKEQEIAKLKSQLAQQNKELNFMKDRVMKKEQELEQLKSQLAEQDDSDDGFDTRDFTFDRETMHNEAFEMMKSKRYVDTATNLANEGKQKFPHKYKAN